MTTDKIEYANQLMKEIDELKQIVGQLSYDISVRKRQIQENEKWSHTDGGSSLLNWLKQYFATFRAKPKENASITIHYEFARPVEFPVDEEFVAMVQDYFNRKLEEKEKEFAGL